MSLKIVKAIVTTNSEEDEHMRVRVKSPRIWQDESDLLPSLNSIYLEKGDVVFVLYDTLSNPIILGKYNNFEQEYPVEGDVLFSAKRGDKWVIGTYQSEGLRIESSEGFIVEGFYKNLHVVTPNESDLLFEDDTFTLSLKAGAEISTDGKDIVIDSSGGKITLKNQLANLYSVLDNLLQTLLTTTPTTQGSPAAQVFNPAIITGITEAKQKLSTLMQ